VNKNKYQCVPVEHLRHVANALLNVDIIITLVIPCLLIVPLNICIVVKIYNTLRNNASLHEDAELGSSLKLKQGNDSGAGSSSSDKSKESKRNPTPTRRLKRNGTNNSVGSNKSDSSLARKSSSTRTALQRRTDSQLKTTRTLVIISSFFVILNAPSHGIRILAFVQSLSGINYHQTDAGERVQEAFLLLYYINFAINFFLYSACAKRFRKTIKRMMKRARYAIVSCTCFNCSDETQDNMGNEKAPCAPCRNGQTAL
jgi:hypothetical protein